MNVITNIFVLVGFVMLGLAMREALKIEELHFQFATAKPKRPKTKRVKKSKRKSLGRGLGSLLGGFNA